MNNTQTSENRTTKRFILTRKNQSGQVAIFVAIIFQVVFVFFALLINVGLLVHHKINLQISTDIAAYYGAMKQAEQMNAIAHINFQLRQSWKLFTWRYRVLGTFGFQPIDEATFVDSSGNTVNVVKQQFPFFLTGGSFVWNGTKGSGPDRNNKYRNGDSTMNCSGMGANPDYTANGFPVGIQDVPFFCVGHGGIKGWESNESNCKISCNTLLEARTIDTIPLNNIEATIDNSISQQVNEALNIVNDSLEARCQNLGPTGALMLGYFMAAFANESTVRSETIKMLAANLSQDAERFVDLDGNSIKEGSKRTFENNLTGANFTGLSASSFQVYNGLSNDTCKFRNGEKNNQTEFLKRIDFKLLNLFIHNCTVSNGTKYKPENVYDASDASGLSAPFRAANLEQNLKDKITSFLNPNSLAMIGYEKNPHCVEYYAVKAFSEPNIPFLPLSKIKLQAVAVAKPFGGSIGPWYGLNWNFKQATSNYTDTQPDTKMDHTLPERDFVGSSDNKITKSVSSQPNFSLFIGDRLGLRNLDYLAAYHSILNRRDIKGTTQPDRNLANLYTNQGTWPGFTNWNNIGNLGSDMRQYDSLAEKLPNKYGIREVEISAIAPNQFDIFHYSIDPDFYNNYYVKLYKNFQKIKTASGSSVTIQNNNLRADFGAANIDGSETPNDPLTMKSFSVKDQILIKNLIFDETPMTPPAINPKGKYNQYLDFLVTLQSSLLTGWTFLKYNDYNTFPNDPVNNLDKTMSFGQCINTWNKTDTNDSAKLNDQNFKTPMNENPEDPPTPGNCVTGGRTGYSVKIVAPSMVSDSNKLENPLDPNFFKF